MILDTRLTISDDAKVILQESTASTIVVTGPDVPAEKKKPSAEKKMSGFWKQI